MQSKAYRRSLTARFGRQAIACGLLAALATSLSPVVSTPAYAAETVKQIKDQVPGYFRFDLGTVEVTAIYDGQLFLETKMFPGIEAKDLEALLDKAFQLDPRGVQTMVNAYLVHSGDELVLIDSGAANAFGPGLGKMLDNLRASGYQPEQVSRVLLTHLHPDHAMGLLLPDGKAAFPNAEVWVAKPEADFWLAPDAATRLPEAMKETIAAAQAAVAPYQATGKLKLFTPGDSINPAIDSLASFGHTPGHTAFTVKSGDSRLLVWGDILHSHALQFARPEVAFGYDADQPAAVATRKALLADAARDRLWVAGAHLPFPGIGRVRTDGQGYAWVPVPFRPE